MGNTTKSLKALLDHLDSDELILPEIQREFVWSQKDVLFLFDSLYRGLPIGSMLIWKAKKTVPAKNKEKKGFGQKIDNFYGYLLDGQQRLTAIRFVRDNNDKYPLLVSLVPTDDEDVLSNRFSYPSKKTKNNPYFIPVSEIAFDDADAYRSIENIGKKAEIQENDKKVIFDTIMRLRSIMNYNVGIIEYEDQDYKKATELFIRFNSTGKKLLKSDLISSELALQAQNLVASKIQPKLYKYNSFPFTVPFLIQCLAVIHKGKMKFKNTSEIWDGEEESVIYKSWDKMEKGLERTIEFLTGTVKWDSIQWLPSINALIPIIYLLSRKKFSKKDLRIARKWLLFTGVHQYFSGSVYSELDAIIRNLAKGNDSTPQKLWNKTRKDLPKLKAEDFNTNRKTGGIMSLYVSMLRDLDAKDWFRNTRLDGSVIGHNASLEIHHFFPKALLMEKGYGTDSINTFANYVIICKQTNLEISKKEPYVYLKEYKVKNSELKKQCIPEDEDLWQVKNYKKFLTERKKLLSDKANNLFY